MSYTPYVYNGRNNTQQSLSWGGREPETLLNPQHTNGQSHKSFQPWNRQEQTSHKSNTLKSQNSMETGYGRIMTQGSLPNQSSKPITPISTTNYNQSYQTPTMYQPTQANKFGGNQLFKSSIYGNNQQGTNGNNYMNQRINLNHSGGKVNNFNNITPPRRMPRVSQPSLPSDMNYYGNDYLKNTATMQSPLFTTTEKETNFVKVKNFNTDSPIKQQKIQRTQPKTQKKQFPTFLQHQTPMRRSSLDVSDSFVKPLIHSGRKKFAVNDFIRIKQLGTGKYGTVYLSQQKQSGYICALKQIEKQLLKDQQITQQFIRQLKIQMYLNHPNIIKMYGFFQDDKYIYTILEVGTGGQLFHQLKKSHALPQAKVAGMMKQVCDAVRQIHSLRIIHRDIKPQNIVLHQNVVKLCDFGWSVHQDKNLRTTFCGTPLYVCPEILKGKQYDQKIDIWSLGIMMYQMLIGENPFKITKEEQLIKIIKDEIVIPNYVTVSKQARDFLDKSLKKNPSDRVTIRELVQHQFFKKYPDKQSQKNKMMNL